MLSHIDKGYQQEGDRGEGPQRVGTWHPLWRSRVNRKAEDVDVVKQEQEWIADSKPGRFVAPPSALVVRVELYPPVHKASYVFPGGPLEANANENPSTNL